MSDDAGAARPGPAPDDNLNTHPLRWLAAFTRRAAARGLAPATLAPAFETIRVDHDLRIAKIPASYRVGLE